MTRDEELALAVEFGRIAKTLCDDPRVQSVTFEFAMENGVLNGAPASSRRIIEAFRCPNGHIHVRQEREVANQEGLDDELEYDVDEDQASS